MAPPDEHRERFHTYKNYVGSVALRLKDSWGTGSKAFPKTFDATRAACSKINPVSTPVKTIFPALSRGWSHLLTLWRDTEEEFFEEANAWTPAKAWYAVHHGFSALVPFIAPQDAKKDRTHEQTLRLLRQLVTQRKLMPPPFDLCVTGYGPDIKYHGFTQTPTVLNTLTMPYNAEYEDYAAMFLRKTADHRSERVIKAWRQETKRKNVLAQFRPEIVKRLGPTCVFDLLYRLRTRANYGDVDTFVLGALDADDAREFARDLCIVTDGALAAIEGVLASYIGLPTYKKAIIEYTTKRKFAATSPTGIRLKHVAKLTASRSV